MLSDAFHDYCEAFKTSTVVQLPGADCTVQNCIYLVSCLKCSVQYVGKCSSGKHGDRQLKHRISEHRGTIVNEKVDKAVGEHFNSRGHQLSDLAILYWRLLPILIQNI